MLRHLKILLLVCIALSLSIAQSVTIFNYTDSNIELFETPTLDNRYAQKTLGILAPYRRLILRDIASFIARIEDEVHEVTCDSGELIVTFMEMQGHVVVSIED